jgi:hypothetical protein
MSGWEEIKAVLWISQSHYKLKAWFKGLLLSTTVQKLADAILFDFF